MLNLFRHELFSRWVSILGWGIGLSAFAALYVSVYPQMADEMAGLANLNIYRMMGIDLGTFSGYIGSVVVQIVPIILGIYVILTSTQTLGGEDDDGTLELVVAMPLERWQIVSMKAAALAIVILLIVMILGAGAAITLGIIRQTVDVNVTPPQLFVAMLGAYPLMLAFFGIGLFIGAITPNRRIAIGIMAFLYVGSYVLNSVAGLADSLTWLETFSLFSYVNTTSSVFSDGLALGDVSLLLIVAGIFFGLAVVAFERRNITVGQWIWQRGQVTSG